VTDNRTGESYDVEITDGTVKAMDFRQIKVGGDDFGLMTYDPAFTNTAACRSEITYIDGDRGILQHRGYSIEQLCEQSSYLEVAYLLIHGELPTKEQLDHWEHEITIHTTVHGEHQGVPPGLPLRDAHPMGMLLSCVGALSTFYPDASDIESEEERHMAAVRLIAKMPTLAAFAYRHSLGLPYNYPDTRPELPRQLPLDDVQDDRGEVRAGRTSRARARHPLDPSRGPRAELLDQRGYAPSARRGSIPTPPSRPALRRCTARCTAARTRPCCGCSTASAPRRTSPTSSRA